MTIQEALKYEIGASPWIKYLSVSKTLCDYATIYYTLKAMRKHERYVNSRIGKLRT